MNKEIQTDYHILIDETLFTWFSVNGYNKMGAVGYIPWFAVPFYPVTLIKVDSETNEPIRGEDGLCIRCKPGYMFLFLSINF